MAYTYQYDTAYHGPAVPVVEIEVGAADADNSNVTLRALVDSGADATMIPVRYLQQLGAKVVDRLHKTNVTNVRSRPVVAAGRPVSAVISVSAAFLCLISSARRRKLSTLTLLITLGCERKHAAHKPAAPSSSSPTPYRDGRLA